MTIPEELLKLAPQLGVWAAILFVILEVLKQLNPSIPHILNFLSNRDRVANAEKKLASVERMLQTPNLDAERRANLLVEYQRLSFLVLYNIDVAVHMQKPLIAISENSRVDGLSWKRISQIQEFFEIDTDENFTIKIDNITLIGGWIGYANGIFLLFIGLSLALLAGLSYVYGLVNEAWSITPTTIASILVSLLLLSQSRNTIRAWNSYVDIERLKKENRIDPKVLRVTPQINILPKLKEETLLPDKDSVETGKATDS